jgi:hypothetical protein
MLNAAAPCLLHVAKAVGLPTVLQEDADCLTTRVSDVSSHMGSAGFLLVAQKQAAILQMTTFLTVQSQCANSAT